MEYAGRLYLLLGTVQKIIDKTRQAVMANFDPEEYLLTSSCNVVFMFFSIHTIFQPVINDARETDDEDLDI